jgi:hypothetical protein
MKRALLAVAVLLSFVAVSANAQTTYSSTAPFVCDAASRYPVTSFYQFSCRGIKLASRGNVVGSFYLFSSDEVQIAVPVSKNSGRDQGGSFCLARVVNCVFALRQIRKT